MNNIYSIKASVYIKAQKQAKRRANLQLHFKALSVYKRGMDSERQRPWIMSSPKVVPLEAAAVVLPVDQNVRRNLEGQYR